MRLRVSLKFHWIAPAGQLARPMDKHRDMKATTGTHVPATHAPSTRIAALEQLGRRKTRGAVMVEYAFLLAFVFIPLSVGIVEGGKVLIKNYRLTRGWVLKNSP